MKGGNDLPDDFETGLKAEVEQLLAHPLFRDAPSQRNLLKFMFEETLSGNRHLTQYEIATRAFGKGSDFDETTDSYVRVQMSRLRKTLAAYYRIHEPVGHACLYVPVGSYELHLAPRSRAYPVPESGQNPAMLGPLATGDNEQVKAPSTVSAPLIRRFGIGKTWIAMSMVIAALGLIAYWLMDQQAQSPSVELGLSPPTISYSIDADPLLAQDASAAPIAELAEVEIRTRINRSIIGRLKTADADYHLDVTFDASPTGQRRILVQLLDRDGAPVFSSERTVEGGVNELRTQLGWELSSYLAPPGVLGRHMAGQVPEMPRNGFECFLIAEQARNAGLSNQDAVRSGCLSRYQDSPFYPYLQSRLLFSNFQEELAATGEITRNSPHYRKLMELLTENPDNPYLAALGAKVFFAMEECAEAKPFMRTALNGGRNFPALELMIMVEQTPCLKGPEAFSAHADRIREIVEAQQSSNALLDLYAMAGLFLIDRFDLAAEFPAAVHAEGTKSRLIEVTTNLHAIAEGDRSPRTPAALRMFVWNRQAFDQIVANVRSQELRS